MIGGHGVQPCAEWARGVILRKFLPHFNENIHGGVFGVLARGHGPAAETENRGRVLAIQFAPGLGVAGLGSGDPLLGGGLFRGVHPLGMSPRIHQVVRGNGVKYFIAETIWADCASHKAAAESTVSDSKLCVETRIRCTLSARETQAGTRKFQNFNKAARTLAHIQPRFAADSKWEETCSEKLAREIQGQSFLRWEFFLPGMQPSPRSLKASLRARIWSSLGYNDLQGRSAYQPTIHKQGNRWIAYIGHHGGSAMNPLTGKMEDNGTSVVDVTDPKNPKYLAHIPGDPRIEGPGETGGAQMARVCDGSELPRAEKNKVYLLRTRGTASHEMWDVTDPAKPSRLTVVESGLRDTHKSWWECDTGIAYLVSGAPGWRTKRMGQVYDLSDPSEPQLIRDFGLPGQQPGATGPVPTDMHGVISTGPKGNRVYAGYGTNGKGMIEILDRDKLIHGPKEPTDANLESPMVARLDLPPDVGAHTTFPMLGVDVPEFQGMGSGYQQAGLPRDRRRNHGQ